MNVEKTVAVGFAIGGSFFLIISLVLFATSLVDDAQLRADYELKPIDDGFIERFAGIMFRQTFANFVILWCVLAFWLTSAAKINGKFVAKNSKNIKNDVVMKFSH